MLPEGYRVEDLEGMLPAPTRKRKSTKLQDADGFIFVVNEQKVEGATHLYYLQRPAPSFLAVFNDHSKNAPGWRDHTASYAPPLSSEWQAWLGQNGKRMSQYDFAVFIEEHVADVVSPTGAEMLTMARHFEAKRNVNFSSAIRVDNGAVQLTYDEKVTATGGGQRGALVIPEAFSLAVPVFENGSAYPLMARLRYRIADGGALAIWYDLIQPEKVMEAAVAKLRDVIAEKTDLTPINGMPA